MCSDPIPHDHYNIMRMERTASSASSFTATCEHHDRCYWTPATGHVSEDLAMVTMETGFQLTGVLSEDGMEIAWSNGAFWTRLSACGSFGHELLPLDIPGGFQVGSQLLCTGVWAENAGSEDFDGPEVFAVNLVTADGDIALHVNPRDCEAGHSGCMDNEHVVVRNSFLGGSWGTEERTGDLPLRHDVPFQLRITAGQSDFRITFEGDGSRGEFGGGGSFGLLHEGMECSSAGDAGQSMQYRNGISEYMTMDQCERGCLATPACVATGMIEFGLMAGVVPGRRDDGRCTGPDACKCYLVTGPCNEPIAHESYSIYKLGAPTDTSTRFTYAYRAPVETITRVTGGGNSIQYCDLNIQPDVPLFKKQINGKEWTLVRRVQPGPSWHPATDELLGTDEYGTYCGERGAADRCDTSMATFSIPFGDHSRSSMVWDQIMFASGDMSMFVVLDKAEMDGCTDGENDGQWFPTIASASGHNEGYSVTQYCRKGAEEDPWISVEEHPSQVVYGEGSFDVPAWCDSRGQLAPDLSSHPEVSEIGSINGVTLYKVPMTPGPMTNKRIEKTCGSLGLLTPCYVVGEDNTDESWSHGNCQAVPGHSDHNYLPESIAAQIFNCIGGPGNCQGGNGGPGNDGQMEGLFTVIYNHMDDRPCAIIDGGYCHESEPTYQSTSSRQLYGVCSFAVGVGSCPAPCWTGTAGDNMCPNTCEHCNDDAIMGHGGGNVWVHEVPGGGHRRAEASESEDTAASEPEAVTEDVHVAERRLQNNGGFGSLGGFTMPSADACSMASLQDRLDVVNGICCTSDTPCADGLPAGCNIQCAVVYSKFYNECYHLLMGVIQAAENPDAAHVFDQFQNSCLTAFDPRSLLDTISSAQCCGGASNGHDLAAQSNHQCNADMASPGANWYQIDADMTDHASGVAYCRTQGKSLCPRSSYCLQGPGAPPAGGRRSGDQWAPTSDGDNTWVQVGTWVR